ncbi:MAG: filamentous hemagglutinin N-terminal domain-containing protein, partial [Pseudomonadota bacterium]
MNDRRFEASYGGALRHATALTPWRKTLRDALRPRGVAAAFAGVAAVGMSWTAFATDGGTFVGGSGTISQSGNRTDIHQSTSSGIINWRSFSIGAGEIVEFHHNSASDVTLNRVTGQDPSQIFGQLRANGRVVLVNPNGVFFRPGSRVDVSGLVATTSDIDNADFMAGRLVFDSPSTAADARVVNEGSIRITEAGGFAILHGTGVENRGEILAERGTVALGASESFTVDLIGNERVTFRGSIKRKADGTDDDGALVENSGLIAANGGVVKLSALAVDGLLRTVINTDGIVQADTIGFDRGRVIMSAEGGGVTIGGQVAAVGDAAGERGGDILVRGPKLELLESVFADVSGQDGGGAIELDATEDLSVAGTVRAQGGGGAVITSSEGTLSIAGGAPQVDDGQWTARAAEVAIGAGGGPVDGVSRLAADDVSTALDRGTDVTIEAASGDLTIEDDVTKSTGDSVVSLTLQAARDLIQQAETTIAATSGSLEVDGTAGRDVVVDGGDILTNDGAVTLTADE